MHGRTLLCKCVLSGPSLRWPAFARDCVGDHLQHDLTLARLHARLGQWWVPWTALMANCHDLGIHARRARDPAARGPLGRQAAWRRWTAASCATLGAAQCRLFWRPHLRRSSARRPQRSPRPRRRPPPCLFWLLLRLLRWQQRLRPHPSHRRPRLLQRCAHSRTTVLLAKQSLSGQPHAGCQCLATFASSHLKVTTSAGRGVHLSTF